MLQTTIDTLHPTLQHKHVHNVRSFSKINSSGTRKASQGDQQFAQLKQDVTKTPMQG